MANLNLPSDINALYFELGRSKKNYDLKYSTALLKETTFLSEEFIRRNSFLKSLIITSALLVMNFYMINYLDGNSEKTILFLSELNFLSKKSSKYLIVFFEICLTFSLL